MSAVLLRALALGCVILLGIVMRASKLLPKEAGMMTRQLMFYLTIPAALIVNFSKIQEMSGQMFWVIVFGMLGNAAMLGLGFIIVRKWSRKRKVLYLFSLPGYGIGAFTLSFVQSFLSPEGNVAVCFFDMGNCILCSGACYAIIVEALSEKRNGIDFKAIGKRLATSAPLIAGVFMTVLLLLGLKLPEFVLTLIQPIANANPFVSMVMLGLFFHIELKKEYLGEIAKILLIRTVYAVPMALAFYYLLPFDLVIRQALVLVSFAPATVNGPGFVALCGGDDGLASAANSATILFSLVITVALLGVMGLN